VKRTWAGIFSAVFVLASYAACGGTGSTGVTPSGDEVQSDGGTGPGPGPGPGGGPGGGSQGNADSGYTPRPIVPFGSPGPWGNQNVRYTRADGILETPVVGMSTDETQNLWVATNKALYLLRPGETKFRRYDSADGLHLQDNPEVYCDNRFGTPDAGPRCPIYGGAADPGITEITGGASDEVFVGYAGVDTGSGDFDDPNRHTGKLDRVRLLPDGSLHVTRFDVVSNNHGLRYWHNRTVMRMAYDHFHHPHDLYVGFNHGVTLLRPDKYRPVGQGEWLDTVYMEYMADHLHARVCKGGPCEPKVGESEKGQMMGDWRGLSLAQNGNLWTAGKWTAGKIRWHEDLKTWFGRPGRETFEVAFGETYNPMDPTSPGYNDIPVFRVPVPGDPIHLTSVSEAPDGKVWFGSGTRRATDVQYGVAVWNGVSFTNLDPVGDLGMEERTVQDLVALPDGRILLAGPTTGLTLFNPTTGKSQKLQAPEYLPDNKVRRLELDARVNPFTVHVSTDSGATRLRTLP